MDKLTFGAFARRTRNARGLSQQQCATALGLAARSGFCRLERGDHGWTLSRLQAFAKLCQLTVSELMQYYETASMLRCPRCRGHGWIDYAADSETPAELDSPCGACGGDGSYNPNAPIPF
jgi:transcriptional regulator with XRE-family HTH domain